MKGFNLVPSNRLSKEEVLSLRKEREELNKLLTKDNAELIRPIIKRVKEKLLGKSDLFFYRQKIGTTKKAFLTLAEKIRRRKETIASLKADRAERKQMRIERRDIAGFRYDRVGGIITTPMSQIKRVHLVENTRKYKVPFNKSNFVGVELELISNITLDQMSMLICENKLSHKIRVMTDGSIRSDSSHPHTFELNILDTETGIKSTLETLGKILDNKNYRFSANTSCGTHIHLDMRNRNPQKSYEKLFDNLNTIVNAAAPHRKTCDYCIPNTQRDMEKARRGESSSRGGRYQAINPESYGKHKTIEIRIFEGTTDITKVCGWIDLLLGILKEERKDVVNV